MFRRVSNTSRRHSRQIATGSIGPSTLPSNRNDRSIFTKSGNRLSVRKRLSAAARCAKAASTDVLARRLGDALLEVDALHGSGVVQEERLGEVIALRITD